MSLCVAVPSAVAAVRALQWGWVPASDQATIGTRATEVLTGRTPRLGQLSGASAEVGLPTRSPGPMGYWPFAVTARWGPLWASAVVAAGLSAAAMVASVRLAARRGGPALALAVGLGLVLSARAINPANLASTWNPALGVMPLVLLVLLSWSIGVGEVRLLPVAVLVLSFCAQAHTALAVACLPVLAIGVVAGLTPAVRRGVSALRARERWRPGPAARAVGIAAVVAAGCWALPLVDQAVGDPGNLTRLSRASPSEPFPWRGAGRAVVDVVGVVPAFLRGDIAPADHAQDILLRPSSTLAVITTILVVAGLAGLAGRGIRRRQRELAVPPLLVLALLGAAALVARGTPAPTFLVLTYTLWWTVPVGMLAWVVLGWGVAVTTSWGAALGRRLDGRAGSCVAGLVCAAMVAIGVLSPGQAEPEEPIHDEARAVGDVVAARVERGRPYLVAAGQGGAGSQLVASTAYRIQRAGALPVIPGTDGVAAGPRHVPHGRRCAAVVTIASAGAPVRAGASVVAEVRLPARDGSSADVVVAMGPDDGAPSC
ncbi:MAG TPA: hypothetical protein VF228_14650 [Iamia sp.]